MALGHWIFILVACHGCVHTLNCVYVCVCYCVCLCACKPGKGARVLVLKLALKNQHFTIGCKTITVSITAPTQSPLKRTFLAAPAHHMAGHHPQQPASTAAARAAAEARAEGAEPAAAAGAAPAATGKAVQMMI